jgi:hypothetical protein
MKTAGGKMSPAVFVLRRRLSIKGLDQMLCGSRSGPTFSLQVLAPDISPAATTTGQSAPKGASATMRSQADRAPSPDLERS